MSDCFDIFISYKHREYRTTTQYLHEFLTELGVTAWLDQVEIGLRINCQEKRIKRLIEEAIRTSRLLVFFETYDSLNPGTGEADICFNWQIFEQQFGKEVLIIKPGETFLSSYIISPLHRKL